MLLDDDALLEGDVLVEGYVLLELDEGEVLLELEGYVDDLSVWLLVELEEPGSVD